MNSVWLRRIAVTTGLIVLGALLTLLYAYAGRHFQMNSDNANPLFWGREIDRGNWLLSHWYLGTISYYTSDVLIYALALKFLPFAPSTLYNVYALVYTLVLFLCVWLAGRRGPKRWDVLGGLIAFAPLAFPMPLVALVVFMGPFHVAGFLWILPALVALDFTPVKDSYEQERSTGRLPWMRLILAGVFLFLAVFGDQFVIYHTLLPVLCVSLLRLRQGAASRWNEIAIVGVCVGAWLAAKLCQMAIPHLHGFIIPEDVGNLNAAFVETAHLGENIGYTLRGLFIIFNADFFGMRIGAAAIMLILCLSGLCAVLYSAYRVLASLLRSQRSIAAEGDQSLTAPEPPLDRMAGVACFGMASCLLAYTITNMSVGLESLRYFVPVFFYGGILVGRYGLELWRRASYLVRRDSAVLYSLASLAWLVFFAFNFIHQPRPGADRTWRLARWLQDHNMTSGYGAYWCANILDIQSKGAVHVAAVHVVDGKIAPNLWVTDERWYRGNPVHFLVIQHPIWGGLDEKAAETNFGPADARYDVEGYTVLTWNKDITPLLYLK